VVRASGTECRGNTWDGGIIPSQGPIIYLDNANRMRLLEKKVLVLLTDGVDHAEYAQIRKGFEREEATVMVTSPQESLSIETISGSRRGPDILVDIPFEAVEELAFDGLIIPDGILSTELMRKDVRVITMIHGFHQKQLPIFASGNAVQLLYDSQVLSEQVVVREGTPLGLFVDKAVEVLLDRAPYSHIYRPTMA